MAKKRKRKRAGCGCALSGARQMTRAESIGKNPKRRSRAVIFKTLKERLGDYPTVNCGRLKKVGKKFKVMEYYTATNVNGEYKGKCVPCKAADYKVPNGPCKIY